MVCFENAGKQNTAETIRIAVEKAMALDADVLPFGVPVVAIGGSHRGADTAVVVTPSYSATLLQTVVHEILCKPFDIRNPDPSMDFQSSKLSGGITT